jgi:hypothetical protein
MSTPRTSQLILILLALAVLAGGTYLYRAPLSERMRAAVTPDVQSGVWECDGDGRMCPDGSVVGRTGSACEFAACPGVMPVTGDQPLQGVAVLSGRVSLSPTCPVERMPPDPACAPRAYVTDVQATQNDRVVAETRTTSAGEYVLDLPPGSYSIRAKGGNVFPTCIETSVTLAEGERRTEDISCDTGIR